jgi:hypothetical protein
MKRSGSCQEVAIPLRSEGSFEETSNDAKRAESGTPSGLDSGAPQQADEQSVLQKSLMMLISNPPGSYADSKVDNCVRRID